MKIKNILRLASLSLLTAVISACSFLDTDPAVIPDEGYYDSEKKLIYGLAGVYGVMNSEEVYGHYYSLLISNADDLCYYSNYNNADARPDAYNHSAGTEVLYGCWSKLYEGIKNANKYMEALETIQIDPSKLSVSLDLYKSEARFLRAYYHFMLSQAWGDIPLREKAVLSPNPADVQLAGTPQADLLKWCVEEIEAAIPALEATHEGMPSRVNQATAHGIAARIYLFMAGESVKAIDGMSKQQLYGLAADHAKAVITMGRYDLNPSYQQVFINMIGDRYDTQHYESMWEADFLGDRTSASSWTNGRIGDLMGLKSQSSANNYSEWACNYSYGYYNGTYRLWQLYWVTDRTTDEASNTQKITDTRQEWNLPPYNFTGSNNRKITYKKDGTNNITEIFTQPQSMYKTPYLFNNYFSLREIDGQDLSVDTPFDATYRLYDPTLMAASRNAGKWRRETIYEKQANAKRIYTAINFPILRYSDVLLMYAEASNEFAGAPDALAKESLQKVRTRAGVKTDAAKMNDYTSFRALVRNERGRELAFEGLRKWDLIRWGVFVEQMHSAGTDIPTESKYKQASMVAYAASTYASVAERHIYLPIPTKELAVNRALKQHPLW